MVLQKEQRNYNFKSTSENLAIKANRIDILSKLSLYIKQTAQNSGTLTNVALDSELSLYDDDIMMMILFLARTLTPYYQHDSNYQIPKNRNKLKRSIHDQYHRI